MQDRRFFTSKTVLILGPVAVLALTVCTLLLCMFTYALGTQTDISPLGLTALGSVCALNAITCFVLGKKVAARHRDKQRPVISLQADRVTYATSAGELISVEYLGIRGVEIEQLAPKLGGGHILIRKTNAATDKVFIANLNESPTNIFLAFKDRLPHLQQPHSVVRRLGPMT